MIPYLKNEIRELIIEIKKLDFKVTFIFLSVSIIIFLSMEFASPNFYYQNFGKDKFLSRVYWFLTDGLLMFVLPVLAVKFLFKEKLKDYGFTWGDKKFGFITSGIFLVVMLITVWIVSATPVFASAYPQGGARVKESFGNFVFYEFCILIYMLGWEFLWRGYMLFGLRSKFGYYSIFIQMIPFFILHKGKPEIELFASIFAGIILGIQALRSGSFLYCWILHWLVMLFIDGISVLRSSKEIYGIGISDFFNLFF